MKDNRKMNSLADNDSINEGFIMATGTIRTMEVFAGTIKGAMEAFYGIGYNISIQSVTKNNNTHLTGLIICEKGINIAPAIYLESLFAAYQDGMTLEGVFKEVVRLYEQNKTAQGFDGGMVMDFGAAKDRICFKLVNAERNRDMLTDVPHIPYHDLAIVFYILVSEGVDGTGTVLVRNSLLDMWGADVQILYHAAMENTRRIFRGSVQSMGSIMEEIMGDMQGSGEVYDMAAAKEDAFPMYVATNDSKLNGASVLLYPDLLKDFAECAGSDFYILPSSVHEIILLPDTVDTDLDHMKRMVREINGSEVAPEEVLSDSVYFYNRAKDRVEML